MPQLPATENWGRDAVLYELHVRAFSDANGDGIGDLAGLIAKLDYLVDLGVTAVWLLPFYPSPLRDDGYDIADFFGVHTDYGNLRDFRRFLREAHRRGLRVLTELVLNHTSVAHPWFKRARYAPENSGLRNFYVWSSTPERYGDARIIFRDFENSNWTYDPVAKAYYWHRFYSHQPDLNYDHPPVRKAMFRAIDFWLGMGVDGLRLDAVPYLFEREGSSCENLPETHAFLRELRRYIDKRYPGRILLAEANQWPEDAAAYFGRGDECHMAFHFPLMPRLFLSLQMEDAFPITDILASTPKIPETCHWATFLRNHDELTLEMVTDEEMETMLRAYARDPRTKINVGIRRRLAPLLGNDRRKIELMNILLLSLPGTPVLYYGDEIGMGDNYFLGDRSGVRTPMQWSPDRNAGFSRANPLQLYLPVVIDPEYHYQTVNVETQERNLSSLLWWTRKALAIRKRFPAMSRGEFEVLSGDNMKVFAFARRLGQEVVVVVANLSGYVQSTGLHMGQWAGRVPEEIFGRSRLPAITTHPYRIVLGPYGYYLLVLHSLPATATMQDEMAWEHEIDGRWQTLITGSHRELFESEILPRFLRRSHWFWGKDRSILRVSIIESIRLTGPSREFFFLILSVTYTERFPDLYCVPVTFEQTGPAFGASEGFSASCISRLKTSDGPGVLIDAAYEDDFLEMLLALIRSRRGVRGNQGVMGPLAYHHGALRLPNDPAALAPRIVQTRQSNTLAAYGTRCILKLYRRIDEGINPELEISRTLTYAKSPLVPAWLGALEYRRPGAEPMTLAVLHEFIDKVEPAWDFALGHIRRYFESILQRPEASLPSQPMPASCAAVLTQTEVDLAGKMFLDKIGILGLRTAQLHEALASLPGEAFAPEPLSSLYRRALLQSMQGMTRRVFAQLRAALASLPEPVQDQGAALLPLEPQVIGAFRWVIEPGMGGQKTRVHGDFHLHQALFTGQDFYLIDFEGEPERPFPERRIKASPLKDVAGMIRSFHYAASAVLWMQGVFRPEDSARLEAWIEPWLRITTCAYFHAYLQHLRGSALLPGRQEHIETLLRVHLLEKAVYELGYELRHRPDWICVALAGVKRVLELFPSKQPS